MDLAEAGPLGDGSDPAVGSAPIEAAAVVAEQFGPDVRSPMARSIVLAVLGTIGITAGLLPFPTMRKIDGPARSQGS